jgi:hypothetical protein
MMMVVHCVKRSAITERRGGVSLGTFDFERVGVAKVELAQGLNGHICANVIKWAPQTMN